MRTTIDKAGRVVIPKALRDRVGLGAGEVEIYESGSGLTIEPAGAPSGPVLRHGRLVFPSTGVPLTDGMVRDLIDEGRAERRDRSGT